MSKIIHCESGYSDFLLWLKEHEVTRLFVVCDDSLKYMTEFASCLSSLSVVYFRDFTPNPLYESVVAGVSLFRSSGCTAILAVGGGSAIDVAKCIKLYSNMDSSVCYLDQVAVPNGIPLIAMPTTAGTGSEATRYAVLYYEGAKQSITSDSIIPSAVLVDPRALSTLPLYQKKSTMMDALCHAIESYWSVNSTDESKEYSRKAISLIFEHMDGYLSNTFEGNRGMLLAAHMAGKAINISQTTAGHAMCYKITSMFGCAHGHAAALCDRVLFPWMVRNTSLCIDPRGEEYLRGVLDGIGQAFGCADAFEGASKFVSLFDSLELGVPGASEAEFSVLKTSVNPVRLKNHPVALDEAVIDMLYHEILNGEVK